MPRFKGLCDFDYGDLHNIVQVETLNEDSFVYKLGDKCDKIYALTSGLAV